MLNVRIGRWFNDKFGGVPLPIGSGLGTQSLHLLSSVKNKIFKPSKDYSYEAMTGLIEDDRVNSLIYLIASMASEAYKGITILPKSIYTDTKLTDKEIKLLDEATTFAKRIHLKDLFFTYSKNGLTYGDYIERMEYDKEGVQEIKSLPLNCITILPEKKKLEPNVEKITLMDDSFYCLNESDPTPTFYSKKDIIHFSFDKRGQWRKDILSRDTYGLYSNPPIAVLSKLVKWKEDTIENDIKWRQKMLPKEHFTLNTEEVSLEKFNGTIEEKIEKSTKATWKILTDFKTVIDDRDNPDKSIITTPSVDSKVLEASGANYATPNETLQQINRQMGGPMGMNEAFLGGEVSTGNGVSTSAMFASMRVSVVCNKIADVLVIPIRKHLRLVFPDIDEKDINRIEIQTNASLSQVILELSKVAMNLGLTGLFSEQEIREILGYSHTTQNPYTKLIAGETILDGRVVRNSAGQQQADGNSETPNKSDNNQTAGAKRNNNLGTSAK